MIAFLCFSTANVIAQDLFKSRQLTFNPYQQGFPCWSPDGNYIVFQHTDRNDTIGHNGLWIVSEDGTKARQIFKGVAEHPQWSPDNNIIVFDADTGKSINMIPAKGGPPVTFLPDSVVIMNGGLPRWSPDASQIAFVEGSSVSLYVYNTISGHVKKIFHEEGMLPLPACWSPDGSSVLIALMDRESRRSTIWKISTDGKTRQQISGHHENFYRHLAISPDGTLLVYAAMVDGYLGLYIMPSSGGRSIPLSVSPQAHSEGPSWSPDGTRIALSKGRYGQSDIWIIDINMAELKKELQMIKR